MSFMQPQIYRDSYFEVETTAGTEIIPSDVIGRTMSTHVEAFLNYLEGTPLDDDAMIECQEGFLCRMSAPGYMDCTEWTAFRTEQECRDFLSETYDAYGEESEEE